MQNNYELVDFNEKADIYVINTCTVTNIADRKSRQMLRKVKEINKDAVLVACGCYAQVAKEELEKIEEINLICGVNEKNKIVQYVEEYIAQNSKNINNQKVNKKITKITDVMQQKEFLDFGQATYTEKTRAVIKIQDGCDRFCTYCIIPYARGRVRSRKIESIVSEVEKIAKQGIKEIVITGIHIASYGKDFSNGISLIDLLEKLNEVEGIERIRLGSLEPTIINEEFLNRLTKLEKICDHFHLSLQSGCDETLKRMNRKYTTKEFEKVTELLRKFYPNVSLTTDVIVGFPGETESEFEETYKFLEKINFYKMHIFKYSQRKGTKAAVMPNQIDGNKKEERSRKLIELSNRNEMNYNNQEIGKELNVLWEEKEGNYIKGHTSNYKVVKMPYKPIENTITKVKIDKTENLELIGTGN